jgi:hypothetical protein
MKEKILKAMAGFEQGDCMENFAQCIAESIDNANLFEPILDFISVYFRMDINHSDDFVADFVIAIIELQKECDYYQLEEY